VKTHFAKTRNDWRRWLARNASSASEIWLLFSKKSAKVRCVSYAEAVEEALCFGWIDSIVKSVDERTYAQKFTPRKPASRWSQSNVQRVKKMIAARRMTPKGLAAFADHHKYLAPQAPNRLPAALQRQFRAARQAWENFERFPPGYKRVTIAWVASAKKRETQVRRLERLIASATRNERMKFI
jgi:uncharacterized protein YdeI (YjbR/CyaY-like superfamily)